MHGNYKITFANEHTKRVFEINSVHNIALIAAFIKVRFRLRHVPQLAYAYANVWVHNVNFRYVLAPA